MCQIQRPCQSQPSFPNFLGDIIRYISTYMLSDARMGPVSACNSRPLAGHWRPWSWWQLHTALIQLPQWSLFCKPLAKGLKRCEDYDPSPRNIPMKCPWPLPEICPSHVFSTWTTWSSKPFSKHTPNHVGMDLKSLMKILQYISHDE